MKYDLYQFLYTDNFITVQFFDIVNVQSGLDMICLKDSDNTTSTHYSTSCQISFI